MFQTTKTNDSLRPHRKMVNRETSRLMAGRVTGHSACCCKGISYKYWDNLFAKWAYAYQKVCNCMENVVLCFVVMPSAT